MASALSRHLPFGSALLVLGCTGFFAPTGPFVGEEVLHLELEGSDETAATDAPILQTRFEAVGVGARANPIGPDRIELELTRVDSAAGLQRMLARNAVELAFPGGESLTNVDIEGAKVVRSDFDNLPTVFATFTDSGKARFCELSGQYVGKPVAIRVDDTELSAPVIFEAICGGQIQITLGHSVDQAETEREAVALAAALDTPVLGSSWVIALIAVGSP